MEKENMVLGTIIHRLLVCPFLYLFVLCIICQKNTYLGFLLQVWMSLSRKVGEYWLSEANLQT